MQIFQWSEYLKALRRDIERRQRLHTQNQAQPVIVTPPKPSYKFHFYFTLLVFLSTLIWMVPALLEKYDWYWQTVVQVLVTMVVMALYFSFDRRRWYITVGVALVCLLAVILFKQGDAKQQLITGGWAILAMIIGTVLWELLKLATPKSKN